MDLSSRWEWRAFGGDFGVAEQRIREVARDERASDETYLVSPWSDLHVSIRNGAIEVKSLERTNASGLEKWRHNPPAPFPIEAATIDALLTGWHIDHAPFVSRRRFPDIRFLSVLGTLAPDIALIPVTKRRYVGALSGCLVELATIHVEGELIQTLAIEHEDASRVTALLTDLGLDALDNVNYVNELRRIHATSGAHAHLGLTKDSEPAHA